MSDEHVKDETRLFDDLLEPAAVDRVRDWPTQMGLSTAHSLKRIADALENIEANVRAWNPMACVEPHPRSTRQ